MQVAGADFLVVPEGLASLPAAFEPSRLSGEIAGVLVVDVREARVDARRQLAQATTPLAPGETKTPLETTR